MKKQLSAILVVCAFFFCAGSVSAEKLTLMLDWFPNIDHLPIYVAQERGLFKEKGLEVEIISPSETADGLKLAASGNVDMAVSYEPQTIIAASAGLDVRVVGRLVEHPLTTLLFLKNSGIATPKDLEGKKIGYTVPGLMDVMLKAFMTINGVQNYEAINVGFTIVPSLVAGKVDAVMGPFKTYETVTMAHENLEAGYFELEKWGIPDYEELIFVCGTKTLVTKQESIKGFVQAIEAATAFMREQPEEALKTYLKAVPEADSRTETEAFHLTLPFYAAPGGSDVAAWQRFADFSLEHELIEKPVKAVDLIHIW
ncbi:MAG: ABC transporter substrate-binding protein [Proteobacteria bacterium]|nr:ABC transporter substrate-binding protein [Pseudomonadota bacterium]MBU1419695.1 ABC transporter substrate-binding protein [Pseudomonadota bacterium]MBU1456448.1 ABC transporter substrate-binding protein [Pseudomonadota bacterium]